MKFLKILICFWVLFNVPILAMSQAEKIDLSMIDSIKQEGLKNSNIKDRAFWLTDFVGPRLTGSTGNNRGNEWAKKTMEEIGLQNVRIEAVSDFSQGGWDNLKTYAALTVPYYTNFACSPVAWTGSTNGLVKSEVILLDVNSEADLEKYNGKVTGKILLMPSLAYYGINYEPLASRLTDAQLKDLSIVSSSSVRREQNTEASVIPTPVDLNSKMIEFFSNEGAAMIIYNAGTFNVPTSTGGNYKAGTKEPIAQLNLPYEDHARMERLLRHHVPVEMEVEVKNKFTDGQKVYNVIGEIPGIDDLLKNETVLIGAHIDSWHGGTGAADNASGCVVMMEALRILIKLNVLPRRTIRIALWGGEEQGLIGSRGFVDKYLVDSKTKEYKPEYEKLAVYFNMDRGSGKYRGIYIQGNKHVRPIFKAWLIPFADMGASTVTIEKTLGSDHCSFDEVGLPGFQFIQDEIEYKRGYHTNMDTYERLVMEDLKYNAIITASFVYNAAMRNTKLPRKTIDASQP